MIAKIKDRGACVIRNTFAPEQARSWDDEIANTVEQNRLNEKLADAAEDKYFGTLAAAKPQIMASIGRARKSRRGKRSL